jgi:hypothetical protein
MHRAFIATLVLLGAAACGLREVKGPPGEEQVVVQGVLNAQASEQVLWIERTTPAGDPINFELRPLASPPTRIEVRDSAGTLFSYQPDTANAARFVGAFTPVHGRRYELLVEAGAYVVRGRTVVPTPLTIVDPAADTVAAPVDSGLRVSWASGSSPWVLVFASRGGAPDVGFPLDLVRRDTSYLVRGFSFFSDSIIVVAVLAVDSVTARVTVPFEFDDFRGVFEGNLTGGAGFFGATTGDRLVVRQP